MGALSGRLGGSHGCDPQRLAVGLGWPTGGLTGGADLRTTLVGGWPAIGVGQSLNVSG